MLDNQIKSTSKEFSGCKTIEFNKSDIVFYQKDNKIDQVKIVGVHKDDFPNIYYTIAFSDGSEKQTYPNYLTLNKPSKPNKTNKNDIYTDNSNSSKRNKVKIAIIDPTQTFSTWYDNNIDPIHKEYNDLINNSKWLSIVKEEFINKIDKLVTKNTIEIKKIFIVKQNQFNDYIDKCFKSIEDFINFIVEQQGNAYQTLNIYKELLHNNFKKQFHLLTI